MVKKTFHAIGLIVAGLGACGVRCASGADYLADYRSAVSEALASFVNKGELAGAVALVANAQRVLDCTAVGWADREKQVRMEPGALFWVASQTKPLTAAAVLSLVDAGKLSLDDPVSKYLPEFRAMQVVEQRNGDQLTLRPARVPLLVRHLMTHSGGMGTKTAFDAPTFDAHPLEYRAKAHALQPLECEPGSSAAYSNAGFTVLGRIIEVASGTAYADYLQEHLIGPLKMKDTTFWPSESQCARLVRPYAPNESWTSLVPAEIRILKQPLSDRSSRHPMAQGGLFSTAHDLSRFYQMLLNDGVSEGVRILSSESARRMRERQTPPEWKGSFSCGLLTTPSTFGHMGSFGTDSQADVEKGLVFVWLTQQSAYIGGAWEAEYLFRREAGKLAR